MRSISPQGAFTYFEPSLHKEGEVAALAEGGVVMQLLLGPKKEGASPSFSLLLIKLVYLMYKTVHSNRGLPSQLSGKIHERRQRSIPKLPICMDILLPQKAP